MISTYPVEMIKRLEDRIKELEDEVARLKYDLLAKGDYLDDILRLYVFNS